MSVEALSKSEGEYLETLYRLQMKSAKKKIKTSEIADYMNIQAPSVTQMIQKLEKKGYLKYSPRKGVILSDDGKKLGKLMLERHRISELFISEILGISDAHEIACELEHILTPEMTERLISLLKIIDECPHVCKIPIEDPKDIKTLEKKSNVLDFFTSSQVKELIDEYTATIVEELPGNKSQITEHKNKFLKEKLNF